MPAKRQLDVEVIAPPGGSHGDGLHWFRVEIDEIQGRCYITTEEAQQLHQLTTRWVKHALEQLGRRRGWHWLKSTAASSSGLMLHCSDARDSLPSHSARDRIRSEQ